MAKLSRQHVPFTQIANDVLNDKKLTFKAKGIFSYMFSKPDGWQFSADRIVIDSKDNRTSILSGIKELKDNGYLESQKLGTGRVKYTLKYSQDPQSENLTMDYDPQSGFPTMRKPHNAKTRPISNKELISNKDKESNILAETSSAQLVSEVIKKFETVNPNCKNYYNHRGQRNACQFLIETYGFDKVLNVIKFLPNTNVRDFFPTITTPVQLKEKWANLEAKCRASIIKSKSRAGHGIEI